MYNFDLNTLDGTNGFAIPGLNARDDLGVSVSDAGDINNDGFADIIVGAYRADPGGKTDAGTSYVVFGQASGFPASFDVTTLDGTNGFAIPSLNAEDNLGGPVSSAGDINNDGYGDIIVGANGACPSGKAGAGTSYVVFGYKTTTGPSTTTTTGPLTTSGPSTTITASSTTSAPSTSGPATSSAAGMTTPGNLSFFMKAGAAGALTYLAGEALHDWFKGEREQACNDATQSPRHPTRSSTSFMDNRYHTLAKMASPNGPNFASRQYEPAIEHDESMQMPAMQLT